MPRRRTPVRLGLALAVGCACLSVGGGGSFAQSRAERAVGVEVPWQNPDGTLRWLAKALTAERRGADSFTFTDVTLLVPRDVAGQPRVLRVSAPYATYDGPSATLKFADRGRTPRGTLRTGTVRAVLFERRGPLRLVEPAEWELTTRVLSVVWEQRKQPPASSPPAPAGQPGTVMRLTSPAEIKLVSPRRGLTLTGIGLQAWGEEQELVLERRVRGTFERQTFIALGARRRLPRSQDARAPQVRFACQGICRLTPARGGEPRRIILNKGVRIEQSPLNETLWCEKFVAEFVGSGAGAPALVPEAASVRRFTATTNVRLVVPQTVTLTAEGVAWRVTYEPDGTRREFTRVTRLERGQLDTPAATSTLLGDREASASGFLVLDADRALDIDSVIYPDERVVAGLRGVETWRLSNKSRVEQWTRSGPGAAPRRAAVLRGTRRLFLRFDLRESPAVGGPGEPDAPAPPKLPSPPKVPAAPVAPEPPPPLVRELRELDALHTAVSPILEVYDATGHRRAAAMGLHLRQRNDDALGIERTTLAGTRPTVLWQAAADLAVFPGARPVGPAAGSAGAPPAEAEGDAPRFAYEVSAIQPLTIEQRFSPGERTPNFRRISLLGSVRFTKLPLGRAVNLKRDAATLSASSLTLEFDRRFHGSRLELTRFVADDPLGEVRLTSGPDLLFGRRLVWTKNPTTPEASARRGRPAVWRERLEVIGPARLEARSPGLVARLPAPGVRERGALPRTVRLGVGPIGYWRTANADAELTGSKAPERFTLLNEILRPLGRRESVTGRELVATGDVRYVVAGSAPGSAPTAPIRRQLVLSGTRVRATSTRLPKAGAPEMLEALTIEGGWSAPRGEQPRAPRGLLDLTLAPWSRERDLWPLTPEGPPHDYRTWSWEPARFEHDLMPLAIEGLRLCLWRDVAGGRHVRVRGLPKMTLGDVFGRALFGAPEPSTRAKGTLRFAFPEAASPDTPEALAALRASPRRRVAGVAEIHVQEEPPVITLAPHGVVSWRAGGPASAGADRPQMRLAAEEIRLLFAPAEPTAPGVSRLAPGGPRATGLAARPAAGQAGRGLFGGQGALTLDGVVATGAVELREGSRRGTGARFVWRRRPRTTARLTGAPGSEPMLTETTPGGIGFRLTGINRYDYADTEPGRASRRHVVTGRGGADVTFYLRIPKRTAKADR